MPHFTHPAAMSKEEAGAYFKALRTGRKLRQQDVIDGTTIPNVQYLSALESGRYNVLNSDHFPSLVRFFNLSAEEIERIRPGTFVEVLPQPSPPPIHPAFGQKTDSVEPQHDVTLKNVYDLAQASKPLEDMEPDPDISPIPVLREDLYPGTELFRVRGDSMSVPAGDGIDEGDIIYVDTRDVSARAGEIYLLHIPGNGVTVKRVRELGGALWLFSDNPDQEQFPPFAVDEARVVGRVHDAYRPLRQFRRRAR